MPLNRGGLKGLRRKLGTGRCPILASYQQHNCTAVSTNAGFADFSLQIVTADGWSLPPYKPLPEMALPTFTHPENRLGFPKNTWNNNEVSGHYYIANKFLSRCGRKMCLQEERSGETYCTLEIQRRPTGSLSACPCLRQRISRFFKSQAKVTISINCTEISSPCCFTIDTICVRGVIQILDGTYLAGLAPLFTDKGFVITHNEITVIPLKQYAVWQRQLLGHFIQAFRLQIFNAVSFSQDVF